MNQLAFLDNKQMRDENIERLEVLNQVGELLSLPGGEVYTIGLVASYFKVGNEAITSTYKRNTDELNLDGAGVKNKEDFLKLGFYIKTKRGGFDVISGGRIVATGSNKGILLFTKRSVLRVGMLLRDSITAEKIKEELFGYKKIQRQRKEIAFINNLEEQLETFNILKGEKQYSCCGNKYRIDYYIPSLNIAIEYDENGHVDYTYEEHEGRQKEIEKELGCRFIRVTDEYSTNKAAAMVVKEIFKISNMNISEVY